MYKLTIILLCFCLLSLSNCTDTKPASEDQMEQEVAPESAANLDGVAPEMDEAPAEQDAVTEVEENAEKIDHPIRLGQHDFTLQWITENNPGKVQVEFLEENKYQVKGEQKGIENEDFASIDGVLTWEGNQVFQFDGEIVSRVSFVNGGETCIKKGPLHFRATGTRKYWRLKEKDNCEGGNVVDYFDIYF